MTDIGNTKIAEAIASENLFEGIGVASSLLGAVETETFGSRAAVQR